jgi:hypothetical protein
VHAKPVVACFDLVDTLHFLWSVGQARAVQEQTKLVWQPYRDSSVLNAIYTVFRSYGEPGTVEVTQNSARIAELTDKYFDELIDKFLLRAVDHSHPLSLARWMELQRDIRDSALQSVAEIFRDAAEINTEIVDGTKKGIQRLAKIHLISTIALTGMSCAIGIGWVGALSRAELLVAGGTKVGYGVAAEIIKDWGHHSGANAIAIGAVKGGTKELVQYGAEKGVHHTAEKGVEASTAWALKYLPKLRAANAKVLHYSEQVGRKLGSRKHNIAVRRLAAAEAKSTALHSGARNAIRTVQAAKLARQSVPLVFAAYDIYEAFKDYDEETQ